MALQIAKCRFSGLAKLLGFVYKKLIEMNILFVCFVDLRVILVISNTTKILLLHH